jgi:hypothetical protein
MNKKQKMQLILAGIAAVLLIFWLFQPERIGLKITGILSNALLILAMLLSYRDEEKMKKDKE